MAAITTYSTLKTELIDDILDRGVTAVKADRDTIKTRYPK
jgi:hypothetical protein